MRVIKSLAEFQKFRRGINPLWKSLGFVPTMGALHQGHLSLMKLARDNTDLTVTSIFVNPAQFGPNEDFDKYPRTFDDDCQKIIDSGGVDVVLAPNVKEVYPNHFVTRVHIDQDSFLKDQPEAQQRPGFFNGVATVVTKLFNMVRPDVAYFGQKDAIQCIVVKKMAQDLNFSPYLKIHIGETVREPDGLAMSSRNRYLSREDREFAPVMYNALIEAKKYHLSQGGQVTCKDLVQFTVSKLQVHSSPTPTSNYSVEYVSICDAENGQVLTESDQIVPNGAFLSAVIKLSGTRLLDNVILSL